jgi:hypothetical protein
MEMPWKYIDFCTILISVYIHRCFFYKEAIIVFCRSGRRAFTAQQKLQALGYQTVYNAGGLCDLTYLQVDETKPSL